MLALRQFGLDDAHFTIFFIACIGGRTFFSAALVSAAAAALSAWDASGDCKDNSNVTLRHVSTPFLGRSTP